MPPLISAVPMKTRMIRTPVTGPDPANTLVHLEGKARGFDQMGTFGRMHREDIHFRTEFRIDGYQQARHDWYLDNTLVSATAMLRMLNTETDHIFTFAVDAIAPVLEPDGTLAFVVSLAQLIDDEAIFPSTNVMAQMGVTVSAYVLCYEPRAERPKSGWQRGVWTTVDQAQIEAVIAKANRKASASREAAATREDCD